MQDERNLPQDEDAEEVEGHFRHRRGEEPDPIADEDDEVEAHFKHHSPSEYKHH